MDIASESQHPTSETPPKTTTTPSGESSDRSAGLGRSAKEQDVGSFVVALCRDHENSIWIGTEDNGVFRAAVKDDGLQWTQFTMANGLGDDNGYAICTDRLGRVWVGHLNHGVSVYNGQEWRNLASKWGPLGERVFDMACSPLDGDVWIATSLGLSRYTEATGSWQYYTRLNGIPSDQVQALAISQDGTVYIGTQCDGLAIARPQDGFKTWRSISGNLADEDYRKPSGKGLPSSQINDVLVARNGTIYVATSSGLAKSVDRGGNWDYVRGRDHADKVGGRATPAPKSWKAVPDDRATALLPEDFVTTLAEDENGRIWLGFRQSGFAVIDSGGKSYHTPQRPGENPNDYVFSILPMSDGRPFIGGYGNGLWRPLQPLPYLIPIATELGAAATNARESASQINPLPHPARAKAPTVEELRHVRESLEELAPVECRQWAAYMADDWSTQGDWVGRYGRPYTLLCAMDAPLNHYSGMGADYAARGAVGPHGTPGEQLRHWVHWKESELGKVLYNPIIGHRRQAEWVDHGEAYPMTHEGPDVWIAVDVSDGVHRVSMYFMNKDGHTGNNRFRDFLIEVRPFTKDYQHAASLPVLARARVRDFWGGVYKQFALPGPAKYLIQVAKNDSFNTIVSSVMIDQLAGPRNPLEDAPLPWMGGVMYKPPPIPRSSQAEIAPDLQAAMELMECLLRGRQHKGYTEAFRPMGILAYRTARAARAEPALLENWRWQLLLWNSDDRTEFKIVMRRAWEAACARNPRLIRKP